MFERILLPLDGSLFSETAIPYVEFLARGLGSEVTLLHTCRSEQEPYRHMHQVYLDYTANRMHRQISKGLSSDTGRRVRAEILVGEPSDIICDYVQKNRTSLVVMAAYGGSGIKMWRLGSVADKVARAMDVPLLLVRGSSVSHLNGKRKLINRILLPLDGSDVSKLAVPYARELAEKLKTGITLFGMAENAYYYSTHIFFTPYDGCMAEEHSRRNMDALRDVHAYLNGVQSELRGEGAHVTHVVTLGNVPAKDIIEHETKTKADLVVMATRGGGSPIGRWAFGSNAEKVLRGGDLPLLLVKGVAPDSLASNLVNALRYATRDPVPGAPTRRSNKSPVCPANLLS